MRRFDVAVYGTLKQGEQNYRRLLAGKRPFFRGVVEVPYRMYANGEYPMLVPHRDRSNVSIEVFEVVEDELRALDALEEPYGYWRETVHIPALERGVEIYVHTAPPPPGFSLVESGIWSG